MAKSICIALALSLSTVGCFVSHKETVREVPVAPATTIERHSSVESVPGPDVEVHKSTTVERTY